MFLELAVRFFRRIATPSFFIFLLLMGIVGSVAFGLSEMIRGLTFLPLFGLSFLSLLLGWLLAQSRLNLGWQGFLSSFLVLSAHISGLGIF